VSKHRPARVWVTGTTAAFWSRLHCSTSHYQSPLSQSGMEQRDDDEHRPLPKWEPLNRLGVRPGRPAGSSPKPFDRSVLPKLPRKPRRQAPPRPAHDPQKTKRPRKTMPATEFSVGSNMVKQARQRGRPAKFDQSEALAAIARPVVRPTSVPAPVIRAICPSTCHADAPCNPLSWKAVAGCRQLQSRNNWRRRRCLSNLDCLERHACSSRDRELPDEARCTHLKVKE
jgi:hypothetical protein